MESGGWKFFAVFPELNSKWAYLLSSAKKRVLARGLTCPSCGTGRGFTVDQKYFVTTLVRCQTCQLMYRAPTTSAAESQRFYQSRYSQGSTTDLPSDAELERLIATGFKSHDEFKSYIQVLESLGVEPGQRVFDFGCSWGYGSWQLKHHGFVIEAFEISALRAKFARDKLGLDVCDSMDEVAGSYDVFFTSHVLEHVPSVEAAIAAAFRLLRPGGLFVAFTPNGSAAYRSRSPASWHRMWGNVHPQLLDDHYYKNRFQGFVTAMDSSPYKLGELADWSRKRDRSVSMDLSGHELLFVACK